MDEAIEEVRILLALYLLSSFSYTAMAKVE